MNFKSILKKSIAIGALASVAINCQPGKIKDDPALGILAALTVTGLGKGNCAISLNMGTLYSGGIMQAAANTATIFTQAEFEAAAGKTIAELNYATYAAVPFNLKYDAFIKGGGTYTAESRTADINSGKATFDLLALMGVAAAACSANAATPAGTLQAATTAFFNTYTTAEQTALNAAVAGVTSTVVNGALAAGCAAIGAAPYTSVGGGTVVGGAYQARQAYSNGSGILACARIPRSSCSLGGISTATRALDIAAKTKVFNDISANESCRKSNPNFMGNVRTALFTGVPKGEVILGSAADPTNVGSPISEGTTFPNNRVFPESAYPVSGALSAISSNFNVAFPLSTGAVAQASATIPYYKASNVNFAVVDSCESIGFTNNSLNAQSVGPVNTVGTLPLTAVKEIFYSFSPENAAATQYAATRGATQANANGTPTAAEIDAIACNNSFRTKLSIPLAIGGGRLGSIATAISGNAGDTATLTTCLYGGTASGRTTTSALLGTTSLANVPSCPTTAAAAAAKFGDTGLENLANFPDNN